MYSFGWGHQDSARRLKRNRLDASGFRAWSSGGQDAAEERCPLVFEVGGVSDRGIRMSELKSSGYCWKSSSRDFSQAEDASSVARQPGVLGAGGGPQ